MKKSVTPSVGCADSSGCGARNSLLAYAHRISTAAPPFCSLYPPQAALANVPPKGGAKERRSQTSTLTQGSQGADGSEVRRK